MTKRRCNDAEPLAGPCSTGPLLSLQLKLCNTARSIRDTIIPSRIDYLQNAISAIFDQPFWDNVDHPYISGDKGLVFKKPKINISDDSKTSQQGTLVPADTAFIHINEELEEKLEILKRESRYLAAACSSLQLMESLNEKRDDTLLDIFTITQQQATKLRSTLAKVYEERANMLTFKLGEGGESTQLIRVGYEKALQEYDRRIEELAGCQAVMLIASYAGILDALKDSDI